MISFLSHITTGWCRSQELTLVQNTRLISLAWAIAKCKCLEYKEGRDEGKIYQRKTKSLSNHMIIGKAIANFQKKFNGLTKMKSCYINYLLFSHNSNYYHQETGKNASNYIYKLKRFHKLFLGFNNFLKYFLLWAFIQTKWSRFTHKMFLLSLAIIFLGQIK